MLRNIAGEMLMPLLLMGKAAPLPLLPRFSTGMPSLLRTSSLLHQNWHRVVPMHARHAWPRNICLASATLPAVHSQLQTLQPAS